MARGHTHYLDASALVKLAQKHSLDISDAPQLLALRSGTYSSLEGTARASLVTADRKLASAAKSEGMPAWDCVHDSAS